MCQVLNLEDSADEIMAQLGVEEGGHISYSEFVQCRMRLTSEIEQERLREERLRLPRDAALGKQNPAMGTGKLASDLRYSGTQDHLGFRAT